MKASSLAVALCVASSLAKPAQSQSVAPGSAQNEAELIQADKERTAAERQKHYQDLIDTRAKIEIYIRDHYLQPHNKKVPTIMTAVGPVPNILAAQSRIMMCERALYLLNEDIKEHYPEQPDPWEESRAFFDGFSRRLRAASLSSCAVPNPLCPYYLWGAKRVETRVKTKTFRMLPGDRRSCLVTPRQKDNYCEERACGLR